MAHRDIKLENFFLDKTGQVKLADFGLCDIIVNRDGSPRLLKSCCGSLTYLAPEVMNQNCSEYEGRPVDIFSLGVVLYMMLVALMPFNNSSDHYYHSLMKDP